jgi:transcriptional regulator GlxA family with amidase domain
MTEDREAARIGIVDYPGVQKAALYGLLDLFETAERLRRERGAGGQEIVAEICSAGGRQMEARGGFWALILPPSLTGDAERRDWRDLGDWIARRHGEGATICSVCAGAFPLAESGLLAGRRATTHWILEDAFMARFPEVDLDTNKLIVDDGDILTAGGIMAWVDLGLRLIDRLTGPAVMGDTARMFLVDPAGREQSFYSSFSPKLTHGDAAVLKVQHWLQKSGGRSASLADMADASGLGRRTFLRRFQKATGMNPTAYVQHVRVAKAREWLELTPLTVEEIAWRSGYDDAGAFRRVFHRIVGLTPGAYRRRFVIARDD